MWWCDFFADRDSPGKRAVKKLFSPLAKVSGNYLKHCHWGNCCTRGLFIFHWIHRKWWVYI